MVAAQANDEIVDSAETQTSVRLAELPLGHEDPFAHGAAHTWTVLCSGAVYSDQISVVSSQFGSTRLVPVAVDDPDNDIEYFSTQDGYETVLYGECVVV